jgi:hypothetical protein
MILVEGIEQCIVKRNGVAPATASSRSGLGAYAFSNWNFDLGKPNTSPCDTAESLPPVAKTDRGKPLFKAPEGGQIDIGWECEGRPPKVFTLLTPPKKFSHPQKFS